MTPGIVIPTQIYVDFQTPYCIRLDTMVLQNIKSLGSAVAGWCRQRRSGISFYEFVSTLHGFVLVTAGSIWVLRGPSKLTNVSVPT